MVRPPTALAGLLGGLALTCAYAADSALLRWTGLALLLLAGLGAGAALVSRSAPALRVLVAMCFVLLVACVVSVLVDAVGAPAYALVGAGGAVAAGVVLARRRVPAAAGGHRAGGAHR